MNHRIRSTAARRLSAGAVVATAALGGAAAAAQAAASSPTGNRTAVPGGISPTAVSGATVFGPTPASTPETVSFVMKEQNIGALEQKVTSGGFSHFLSVKAFAKKYGADPSVINSVTNYLQSYGISTQVYADDVDVVATGTAGEFDKALQVSQSDYSAPAQPAKSGRAGHPAQKFHGTTSTPSMPTDLAKEVTAILGLTNYAPFSSDAAHTIATTSTPSPAATQAGTAPTSASSCTALAGVPDACNLPSNFASNYKLAGLYKSANGSGQTVGIVTLAALDQGAPQYFWNNVAHIQKTNRTLSTVNVDGGPGAPSDASGSGETDLDTEQSGALAPGANVIVYQAPNTDYGFADAFFDAASQNLASSVSASWGESETIIASSIYSGQESAGYVAAFDEAFLEMAAQGQSGFTSAGDDAAYDAQGDEGTTNLAVDNPGDSPYITSAGGTTLPWTATLKNASTGKSATVKVPAQRIWGWDYLWQPVATINEAPLDQTAESLVVGGGGGFSQYESTPSYQQGISGTNYFNAVPYLTPDDYQTVDGLYLPTAWSFNGNPGTSGGQGGGRAEPDLAADADPETGYLLYSPSFADTGSPVLEGGWGGTSFVAPQFNGSTAVIDSYLGHRVGFWNPGLYAAAKSGNSPVTPLDTEGTSNDNIYYTGTPGTLFNEGAGLGVPNLTKLASDL